MQLRTLFDVFLSAAMLTLAQFPAAWIISKLDMKPMDLTPLSFVVFFIIVFLLLLVVRRFMKA